MKDMPEIKNTPSVQKLLSHAQTQALCRGHEFVMPEHLLLVLLDDFNFSKALEIFYPIEDLGERLEEQLEAIETVPEDKEYEPEASAQMGQLIEIACHQVINSSAQAMDTPHLVMGMLQLNESC